MKLKKNFLLLITVTFVILFSGCETTLCSHEWIDATCTEAKKCNICEETEGESLGHTYVDGICTSCDEVDPNAFFAEDFGFYNNNGMSKWIEITGYSLNDGYVEYEEYGQDQIGYEIKDNVVHYCSSFDTPNFNSPHGTDIYEIVSNNAIYVDSESTWEITERVVSSNDRFIIKAIIGNHSRWFVLEELLNLDLTESYISDPDNPGWETRRYYFKN